MDPREEKGEPFKVPRTPDRDDDARLRRISFSRWYSPCSSIAPMISEPWTSSEYDCEEPLPEFDISQKKITGSEANKKFEPDLSTVPSAQPKIFKDKSFLLVGPDDKYADPPFDRATISHQITHCGGIVTQHLTDDQWSRVAGENVKDHFIIAQSHSLTEPYLKAVLAGLPCIRHNWVKECCDQKKLLKFQPFLLPRGWSKSQEKAKSQKPITNQRQKGTFSKFFCVVVGTKKSACEGLRWRKMLELGGAHIYPDEFATRRDLRGEQTHGTVPAAVIIGEVSDGEKRQLKKNGFKLCDVNWLTECVILGRRLTREEESQLAS